MKEAQRSYGELSRDYRRTVYMHDEWVKHRSNERFAANLISVFNSGVTRQLTKQLIVVSATSIFVIVMNGAIGEYTDLEGVVKTGPLHFLAPDTGAISLPSLVFTLSEAALALLLVFRCNTGYARWNEARTLWGGVINTCRNVVRQSNQYFPASAEGDQLRTRLMANTAAYSKALRNFLRGPNDDAVLKGDLYELAVEGKISGPQADACMAASNRPMFCLNAMSAVVREAELDQVDKARLDASITKLVDLTGACERIFKSPIPLVYTRHSSRFLTFFNILLPLGIWPAMGEYWNHWVTLPTSVAIALFLFGIEEIGVQIEEPFSILPIEAFCNGAITAHMAEMNKYDNLKVIDSPIVRGR
jgi:predicted membrane chloride channel (bestrophin family)